MPSARTRFVMSAIAALCFVAAAFAQMPAYTQAGPIPPALAAAKTVFVSNAGSDSGLFPAQLAGDPDRAYTEFYAALKATGDFTLVADPAQANLVLELRLLWPSNPNKQADVVLPPPMFRLVVYDGKTHYILWTVTQSVDIVHLKKTRDKNFDVALANVLNQFLQITGKAPAPAH